jgi:hypothetical protein
MHRILLSLALISLMASSTALAGDAPNADAGGSQDLHKPSPGSQTGHPKTAKQVSAKPSDGRSEPRSLPLSSAAAYAAEHSPDLPISSTPKSPPPSSRPWTGVYIGAGAGIGASQP